MDGERSGKRVREYTVSAASVPDKPVDGEGSGSGVWCQVLPVLVLVVDQRSTEHGS